MSALSTYDCAMCEEDALAHLTGMDRLLARRFVVCRTCGNKRCPKASAHWQECTGSNDADQPGSFFGPKESWPTKQRALPSEGVAK